MQPISSPRPGAGQVLKKTSEVKLLMFHCQFYLSLHLQRWVVMTTEELLRYCPPSEVGFVRWLVLSV